jgi:hypothetical protein
VLTGMTIGAIGVIPVFAGLQAYAAQPALILGLLLILVLAVALVTGPQTALLSELFPARTRYTAVGLPHNLAAGWIGGMSPFMVAWIAARTGVPIAGLAYPFALLCVGLVVGLRCLPETRGRDLAD